MVARCVRDAKVVGSNPVASTKNSRITLVMRLFLDFYSLRRDSRVGAVLREQNALPYEAWITKKLTAKDDVNNVGAGRAAKGAIPTTSTKKIENA